MADGMLPEDEAADEETYQSVNRRGMRQGFTTGACATAAAKAATLALLTRQPVSEVTIHLPAGRDVAFAVASCEIDDDSARCSVIKDAGDDPDVTHGAEICAEVRRADVPGIHLLGGDGVGVVTRPGLGLELGGAAINPVPRSMINQAVAEAAGALIDTSGLEVEISVPRGAELAKKTLNGRLGILGGISILGTTGIVQPWSTAAWRASVEQAIDVAAANGVDHVVLTTGGRSEKFAMKVLVLPELAFVEMGIFTGRALRRCVERQLRRVSLAGMIGKFSKLAQGHFQTHVAGNQVDPVFLAELALRVGASDQLASGIRGANTARHVQEIAQEALLDGFFDLVASTVADRCHTYVSGKLEIETLLFDFDGKLLGRAESTGSRVGPSGQSGK